MTKLSFLITMNRLGQLIAAARCCFGQSGFDQGRKTLLIPLFSLLMTASIDCLACLTGVSSELEKLYCDIAAKGQGQTLPRFDDFQRNSPETQRLLLTRPAKRAGLALPPIVVKEARAASSQSLSAQALKPQPSQPPIETSTRLADTTAVSGLGGCLINATQIQCGRIAYELLDNRANGKLAPLALQPANTLDLPLVPAYQSDFELHDYLQRAYAIYLEKMHEIGLAGETLSYSKFYYIFEEVRQQKQDFVARFRDMYGYLKKDKSTILVASQHKGKPLPEMASCDPIGDYIVCDERGSNWVYLRN